MSTMLTSFVFLVYCLVGCACASNSTSVNATVMSTQTTKLTPAYSNPTVQVKLTPTPSQLMPGNSTTTILIIQTSTTPANNDSEGLKSYEIIIIATCVAVIVVLLIVALILCLFRRKRTRRLERENNLSYNNMNYESTVKFRLDKNGEASEQESGFAESSKKKNNNRQRPGEYEEVNLSKEVEKPRKYENVTPDNVVSEESAASKQYENVEPGKATRPNPASSSPPPAGQYEKVFVDSAPTQSDENKKKYYENVEL